MIIDQLPNLASVQETDEIPVERGTTTYKATLQKLKDLFLSFVTKETVGLNNVDNVQQYSADNPPPYPVTSVNGKTGDITTVLIETVNLSFTNGTATINAKNGYTLVNAYPYSRPTSETDNPYAIASIQRLENGSYYARNVETGLSAVILSTLIWAAD